MFDIKLILLLVCLMIPTFECMFGRNKEEEETNAEKLTKGMIDETAEVAHFTRRFGFVDYRKNYGFNITEYRELETDHEIEWKTWTPKFWQYMVQKVENMKIRLCESTLKDPVLVENKIEFDQNAGEELIELVSKEVVFLRYKRMPISNYLVKCPITVQGQGGYFAYVTLFERTEKEGNQDFYFILFDLYYEDVRSPTNQVVVVMRTKLGATMSLLQRMKEYLTNFISYSLQFQLDDSENKMS